MKNLSFLIPLSKQAAFLLHCSYIHKGYILQQCLQQYYVNLGKKDTVYGIYLQVSCQTQDHKEVYYSIKKSTILTIVQFFLKWQM